MSGKINNATGVGRSSRGGVSMSRAKRLSNKVDQNKGSNSKLLFGVPLVLAGLGAAAFFGSGAEDASTDVAATTTEVVATADTQPAPVVPDQAAPVIAAAPTPRSIPAPACVSTIETNLTDFQSVFAAQNKALWADYQNDLTVLVQDVINCPEAKFELTGSLELLDLGLANLEVDWNRAAYQLTLTTISTENTTLADAGPLQDPISDADMIRFILR